MRLCFVGFTALFLAMGACSSSQTSNANPDPPADAGATDSDAGTATPTWTKCSLAPYKDDGLAECASIDVPRDYDDPTSGTIAIALKRIAAKTETRRGTLWLLHGGPGASGVAALEGLARELPKLVPDLDYISLDHRGVGKSERLGCPSAELTGSDGEEEITEKEWPACIAALETKYGAKGMQAFTTTAAARDVGFLIDKLKNPGDKTLVWGGSYGSFLAERYMQLFPDQPDGVVIEGIVGTQLSFETYARDMNEVGKQVFAKCAANAACRAKLGDDPWAAAQALIASFDKGHCPELGVTGEVMRSFLGSFLFYEQVRDAIAPLVYRAQRCNGADVSAIFHASSLLFGGGATEGASPKTSRIARPRPLMNRTFGLGPFEDSRALFYQVSLVEFWSANGPTAAAADAELATLTTATTLTRDMARVAALWPSAWLKDDPDKHTLARFDKPLLMLQGGLDPATPAQYTTALRDHFRAPNQTYVLFPEAAHDPANGTFTKDGKKCALSIYVSFIQDPTAALDTSCVANIAPMSFLASPSVSNAIFGTANAWD